MIRQCDRNSARERRRGRAPWRPPCDRLAGRRRRRRRRRQRQRRRRRRRSTAPAAEAGRPPSRCKRPSRATSHFYNSDSACWLRRRCSRRARTQLPCGGQQKNSAPGLAQFPPAASRAFCPPAPAPAEGPALALVVPVVASLRSPASHLPLHSAGRQPSEALSGAAR